MAFVELNTFLTLLAFRHKCQQKGLHYQGIRNLCFVAPDLFIRLLSADKRHVLSF